jgi:hypothetical protein
MVTVLVPARTGKSPSWQAKRTDESNAIVVEVIIEGQRHRLRFPKPGIDRAVEILLASK